jgi:DNA-binding transcriptional MerR regulator
LTASLDRDGDGLISESEIEGAVAALEGLDQNQDGKLTRDELRPTSDTARGREGRRRNVPEQALQQLDDSESEDPQIEFIEQMEEAGFAISALKELLEDERSTTELQLTEIENLQAALFNSKVLVQLIKISEDALGYHKGDELKARQGMKQSLLKVIDITLKIESNIINGKQEAALQNLKELLKLQRQKHKIYQ